MLLVETLKSGDIICLVRDIQGKGIMPHHFKDMTNGQFTTHYGINKEDWFEQQHIPANVFIRTTTKKDGRTRSLIAPHRGRNSQLAVFDDEIFATGSYEFTAMPERWCPIYESSTNIPEGGGELKPVRHNDCYSAWSPKLNKYMMIPTRWDKNLMYCRPYGEFSYDDFEMELLPAAPGVNGVNFKVNGGGGKSGRPKLGAGIRLSNPTKKPDFPDCHDNRYLKYNNAESRFPHPSEVDEWYVPWGEFKPKFRYNDDAVPKGSLTINFPITGIGKIIKGIIKPPRGRVNKPRQPSTDSPYEDMHKQVVADPNSPWAKYNPKSNYNPFTK